MLPRVWAEIENMCPQKGADDCLLKGGNNVGVHSGVHEPVFYGIETVGKDVVIPHDVHITCDGHWGLIDGCYNLPHFLLSCLLTTTR